MANEQPGKGCCNMFRETYSYDCEYCDAETHIECVLQRTLTLNLIEKCNNCNGFASLVYFVAACSRANDHASELLAVIDAQINDLLGQDNDTAVFDLLLKHYQIVDFMQKMKLTLQRSLYAVLNQIDQVARAIESDRVEEENCEYIFPLNKLEDLIKT